MIDEAEESRSRGWMLRFGMPLAAAAALVLLAVSVMLRPASVDSPTMTAQDAPVDAPVNDFTFSVASVNEALAEDDYSGPVDTPEVYAAEVLLALGDTDLFTGITATWLADSDYNDHLDRLDSDEKQTLIELLGSTMIDESLL